MTGFVLAFLLIGILFALTGLGMLIAALRGGTHDGTRSSAERKSTALLIAGMMVLAFGLVLSGFAYAYANTEPYDVNEYNAA